MRLSTIRFISNAATAPATAATAAKRTNAKGVGGSAPASKHTA